MTLVLDDAKVHRYVGRYERGVGDVLYQKKSDQETTNGERTCNVRKTMRDVKMYKITDDESAE